jgi:cell volume regulation protein A
MAIEHLMLGAAILLLASVVASKAFGRFGVPALLVFLVIGMLAGSDGPGGIRFDYPRAAQSLGIVALALILFAGGLDTRWSNIRSVLRESLLLSTLGVALTAVLVALCSRLVLGLTFIEGMLLDSIVSSTDAAAVFGILRSTKLSLPNRLRSLLEFESGSNDPMAVFLTAGLRIAQVLVPCETRPVGRIGRPAFVRCFSRNGPDWQEAGRKTWRRWFSLGASPLMTKRP